MQKKLPLVLTQDEQDKLIGSFNPRYQSPRRDRAMVRLALATGMRAGEVVALRWEHIQLIGHAFQVHVWEGKGAKDRKLWITSELYSELVEQAQSTSGLVFTTSKGTPVTTSHIRTMMARKAAVVGRSVNFHLLRHTALTRIQRDHKDLRKTQEVAGHSSPTTTAIYTRVTADDIRDVMVGPNIEETPDGNQHLMDLV